MLCARTAPHTQRNATPSRKSALCQFMTPAGIARFMAGMFPPSTLQTCRLLDAGAGVGALSCAFLDRWLINKNDNVKAAHRIIISLGLPSA